MEFRRLGGKRGEPFRVTFSIFSIERVDRRE